MDFLVVRLEQAEFQLETTLQVKLTSKCGESSEHLEWPDALKRPVKAHSLAPKKVDGVKRRTASSIGHNPGSELVVPTNSLINRKSNYSNEAHHLLLLPFKKFLKY